MVRKTLAFLFLLLVLSAAALAQTTVYFSPNGGCTAAIVKQLSQAQRSIDVMMYAFTSRPIAEELVKAKERGVKVRVLLDKGQETQKYSKSRYFLNNGIEVRFDRGNGLMHNKVGIIDGRVLLTGSFNWTAQAEKPNRENLLVIADPAIIPLYQAQFDRLWH